MTGRSEVVIERLTKGYTGRAVVEELSLRVPAGKFTTLLGPSGCGKTTTLRCIAGLEVPDHGSISINGRTVCAPDRGEFLPPEARDIGMVFQSYAIWPHMTVFENVAYPLRVRRVATGTIRKRVLDVLELVGLDGLEGRFATNLSGGQQQRVAFARALVARPQLLLFDEPLSNLDAKLRQRMRGELARLQREVGITTLYVTHDQEEALALSDLVVVMHEGKIQQLGTPRDIYFAPANRFVADFIGNANFLDGTVVAIDGPTGNLQVKLRGEDGQVLSCRAVQEVSQGDSVAVVIRPECLHFLLPGDEPGPRANVFSSVVTDVQFLGHGLSCECRVLESTIRFETPVRSNLSAGSTVQIWVRTEDCLALRAGSEPGKEGT